MKIKEIILASKEAPEEIQILRTERFLRAEKDDYMCYAEPTPPAPIAAQTPNYAQAEKCGSVFKLKYGYVCSEPKGHYPATPHECECPNPTFTQRWTDEYAESIEAQTEKRVLIVDDGLSESLRKSIAKELCKTAPAEQVDAARLSETVVIERTLVEGLIGFFNRRFESDRLLKYQLFYMDQLKKVLAASLKQETQPPSGDGLSSLGGKCCENGNLGQLHACQKSSPMETPAAGFVTAIPDPLDRTMCSAGIGKNAAWEGITIAPTQPLFDAHVKAVGEFLREMYAIMVDPLAEGEIKVAEMCATLLKVAREQREQLYQDVASTGDTPQSLIIRCKSCDGTLMYKRENGEIVVYHDCRHAALGKTPDAGEEKEKHFPLESDLNSKQ